MVLDLCSSRASSKIPVNCPTHRMNSLIPDLWSSPVLTKILADRMKSVSKIRILDLCSSPVLTQSPVNRMKNAMIVLVILWWGPVICGGTWWICGGAQWICDGARWICGGACWICGGACWIFGGACWICGGAPWICSGACWISDVLTTNPTGPPQNPLGAKLVSKINQMVPKTCKTVQYTTNWEIVWKRVPTWLPTKTIAFPKKRKVDSQTSSKHPKQVPKMDTKHNKAGSQHWLTNWLPKSKTGFENLYQPELNAPKTSTRSY